MLLTLPFFLYSCLLLPTHPVSADTEGEYACILTDEAYFYPSRDETRGLFLLPKTYFVKVLTVDVDFCKVEYLYDGDYTKKLVGYAKTSDLSFVDFVPETPYLYQIIWIRFY